MSCTYVQSIPRTVLLDTKTGSNLLQWPVVEVENLRMSGKSYDGVALDRGSVVPLDVGKATQVNGQGQLGATAPAANELALCPQPACLAIISLADGRSCACSWTSRPCSRWTRRAWAWRRRPT